MAMIPFGESTVLNLAHVVVATHSDGPRPWLRAVLAGGESRDLHGDAAVAAWEAIRGQAVAPGAADAPGLAEILRRLEALERDQSAMVLILDSLTARSEGQRKRLESLEAWRAEVDLDPVGEHDDGDAGVDERTGAAPPLPAVEAEIAALAYRIVKAMWNGLDGPDNLAILGRLRELLRADDEDAPAPLWQARLEWLADWLAEFAADALRVPVAADDPEPDGSADRADIVPEPAGDDRLPPGWERADTPLRREMYAHRPKGLLVQRAPSGGWWAFSPIGDEPGRAIRGTGNDRWGTFPTRAAAIAAAEGPAGREG